MRTSRTLLLALITTILCAVTVALAPPSAAGGPTSVLLVDQANERATALYASDERYTRLADLVGASSTRAGATELPPGADSNLASGSGITLTWLIHDVEAWRVDRVFLDAPGGPWIASRTDLSGAGSIWDGDPSWHRPSDPEELVDLLSALGLGSDSTRTATAGDVTPGADRPRTAAAASPAAAAPAGSTSGGPLWGLGGMLLGAVLVLGLGRVRQVTQRAPHGADPGQNSRSGARPQVHT